jgi:hypothetical protein
MIIQEMSTSKLIEITSQSFDQEELKSKDIRVEENTHLLCDIT